MPTLIAPPGWTASGEVVVAPVADAFMKLMEGRVYLKGEFDFRRLLQGSFIPGKGTVLPSKLTPIRFGQPQLTAVAVGSGVVVMAQVMTQQAIDAQTAAYEANASEQPDVDMELAYLVKIILEVETQVEAKRPPRITAKTMRTRGRARFTIHAYSRR